MYNIEYEPVDDYENATDIAFHNMKIGDDIHHLNTFIGGQSGYFFANPSKTFQDLERELRDRNFNTHLIAMNPPNKDKFKYILGTPHNKSDNVEYKYECITSCRPKEYALKELLESWDSYEANFEALQYAGTVIVDDKKAKDNITDLMNDNNERFELTSKSDPIQLLMKNKLKAKITFLSVGEVISQISANIVETTGINPTMSFYGMTKNGNPIMVFTVNNKIVSRTAVCIEYDQDGKQIMNLLTI